MTIQTVPVNCLNSVSLIADAAFDAKHSNDGVFAVVVLFNLYHLLFFDASTANHVVLDHERSKQLKTHFGTIQAVTAVGASVQPVICTLERLRWLSAGDG